MTKKLDRIDLVKEIPLNRPLSVLIETSTKCNFSCSFCPTSDQELIRKVGFKKQDMSNELFTKIVKDLQEFPEKINLINYHYMGEPLMNPNLGSLIKLSVDSKIGANHVIRTNGSLLNSKNVKSLVDSGIDRIGISVEAVNSEGYEKIVRRKDMFEKVVNGVTELFTYSRGKCFVFAKLIDFGIPETNPVEFRKIFEPITDECIIEYPRQWNNDSTDTTFGQGVKVTVNGDKIDRRRIVCPFPFYTMTITSVGKCLMCCFDWSSQTEVGDVNKNTIKEIWNSQKVREFWLMHLQGKRELNSACNNCQDLYTPPDNLDDDRLAIINRLLCENHE